MQMNGIKVSATAMDCIPSADLIVDDHPSGVVLIEAGNAMALLCATCSATRSIGIKPIKVNTFDYLINTFCAMHSRCCRVCYPTTEHSKERTQ